MECIIDAAGPIHRVKNRNTLTGCIGARQGFGLNVTFVVDKGAIFDPDVETIKKMESQLVIKFREALKNSGYRTIAKIEI